VEWVVQWVGGVCMCVCGAGGAKWRGYFDVFSYSTEIREIRAGYGESRSRGW